MNPRLAIRDALPNDAALLADLATQLGHTCGESDIRNRIDPYISNPEAKILVATLNDIVVGWLSLNTAKYFYTKPFVEISGFVVDEKERGKGIGKALLYEAERWTKENGYNILRLRTNIKRKEAHRFYENNGFKKIKEQYVYQKEL